MAASKLSTLRVALRYSLAGQSGTWIEEGRERAVAERIFFVEYVHGPSHLLLRLRQGRPQREKY